MKSNEEAYGFTRQHMRMYTSLEYQKEKRGRNRLKSIFKEIMTKSFLNMDRN